MLKMAKYRLDDPNKQDIETTPQHITSTKTTHHFNAEERNIPRSTNSCVSLHWSNVDVCSVVRTACVYLALHYPWPCLAFSSFLVSSTERQSRVAIALPALHVLIYISRFLLANTVVTSWSTASLL